MPLRRCFDRPTLPIAPASIAPPRAATCSPCEELGYLGANEDRFFLQPKVLDLGYAYVSSMQIDKLVQPFLNELAARTHESSSFAVLDNDEVLFVARSSGDKILQISVSIGGRVPAYAISLGHALLSGLPEEEFRSLPEIAQVGPRRQAADECQRV